MVNRFNEQCWERRSGGRCLRRRRTERYYADETQPDRSYLVFLANSWLRRIICLDRWRVEGEEQQRQCHKQLQHVAVDLFKQEHGIMNFETVWNGSFSTHDAKNFYVPRRVRRSIPFHSIPKLVSFFLIYLGLSLIKHVKKKFSAKH